MRVIALAAAAGLVAADSKQRPVAKVITLLKDMQKQLQAEAEEDQNVFDKMQCWCKTNDKAKNEAMKNAEAKIEELTGSIEELTAMSARLNAEIGNLNKELAENTKALEEATTQRTKQLAEFNAEEKDVLKSLAALKAAITVLSKHHGTELLQEDEVALQNIAAVLSHHKYKFGAVMDAVITPSQREMLISFLSAPNHKSYAPQSGAIFGILRNMKDTFDANLAAMRKEEAENKEAFLQLKKAKEEEIEAGQEQIDKKSTQLGDTDEKLASSKQQLRDTKLSLSADEAFLLDLKKKCQMTGQEWEARQKTRQEEITAVNQAIEVLTSDDAHSSFSDTYKFLQISDDRSKASKILSQAGRKYGNHDLAMLANSIKLDAFTKVKKAIDDMIAALLDEKQNEVKKRDWCIDSINENDRNTVGKQRDHKDVEARIEDIQTNIQQLTETIDTLNAEVKDLKEQLHKAGEERAEQNKEFLVAIKDQQASHALLQKAFNHLAAFYAKGKSGADHLKEDPLTAKQSFLQGPASPAGFDEYENSAGGNTVLKMLKEIMNDTKVLQKETETAEEDAQKAYEGFKAETDKSVEIKTKQRVDAEEDRAKAEVDLNNNMQSRDAIAQDIENLLTEKNDLHKQCDFTINNFEIRQEAREQEVQALRQAKDILSGAKFGFLQK